MKLLIAILAAGLLFLLLQLAGALLSRGQARRRNKALHRLHNATGHAAPLDSGQSSTLLKHDRRGAEGSLDRLFSRFRPIAGLDDLLNQARWKLTPLQFLLVSLVAGTAIVMPVLALAGLSMAAVAAGAAGLLTPYFLAQRSKAKRMNTFQKQLPDALDLVARALKAGHAFNSGLRMVADEFPDPIGPEFQATLDEINFGLGADEALRNLANRVDCPDLKFFVVSVNIQRETGGNLSEIVTNIAMLVRERFKLFGKVRVLSAEGRLSAWILIALPFLAAAGILFINPGYLNKLFEHPLGQMMLTGAAVNMALGILAIKRLVVIKV